MMSEFQMIVEKEISDSGGKIIKFIGDASFIVFPENMAKEAVGTLKLLKDQIDTWLLNQSLNCKMRVKAHVGPVVCGKLGPKTG